MNSEELQQHFSQLSTAWTALAQARAGPEDAAAQAAVRYLLDRYGTPVYRYLLGALRSRDAADECYQEFALRLVRGDFKGANPQRGRFRDFLKTSLYHLIVDHQRRQRRRPVPLSTDAPAPAAADLMAAESDRAFLAAWRAALLERAWQALAEYERQTGQPLYAVLRLRAERPELRSAQLAAERAARQGQPVSDTWVRKRLHFARQKFADLLLAEVSRSLNEPTADDLAEEVRELGLLDYCRAALERRRDER